MPQWVFDEQDYNELFNYLALYNGYFRQVLLPVALTVLAGFFIPVIHLLIFEAMVIYIAYKTLGEY